MREKNAGTQYLAAVVTIILSYLYSTITLFFSSIFRLMWCAVLTNKWNITPSSHCTSTSIWWADPKAMIYPMQFPCFSDTVIWVLLLSQVFFVRFGVTWLDTCCLLICLEFGLTSNIKIVPDEYSRFWGTMDGRIQRGTLGDTLLVLPPPILRLLDCTLMTTEDLIFKVEPHLWWYDVTPGALSHHVSLEGTRWNCKPIIIYFLYPCFKENVTCTGNGGGWPCAYDCFFGIYSSTKHISDWMGFSTHLRNIAFNVESTQVKWPSHRCSSSPQWSSSTLSSLVFPCQWIQHGAGGGGESIICVGVGIDGFILIGIDLVEVMVNPDAILPATGTCWRRHHCSWCRLPQLCLCWRQHS